METKDLSTLKIHKLSQAQYDREAAAGNLDDTAIYLTPDEGEPVGGQAIIDVVELPTENIVENVFYRLVTGTFVINALVKSGFICHYVDAFPEVGDPALSGDLSNIENATVTAYYSCNDESVNAYVPNEQSSVFGVPAGWYPVAALMSAVGYTFSGIITDITDDPVDDTFRLLLEYVIWSYKEGVWTSHKVIGWAGTGSSAEIFNHPFNDASGDASHAEGSFTTASGYASHAEGNGTTASGYGSHAEGSGATASGYGSHAEGTETYAGAYSSHAEGALSHAEGSSSHAEGNYSYAEGHYSHAEGYETRAFGNSSHAQGCGSHAGGRSQHTQGEYNITDPEYDPDDPYTRGKYAHIVGNGTSDGERSNAHTLDWEGNAWFAGDVYVGSTSGTNEDEGKKKLATEEFVTSLIDAKLSAIPNAEEASF